MNRKNRNMALSSDNSLISERLLLIPLVKEDEDWFLELNVSPFVRQFLWDNQLIDRETAREIIFESARRFEENQYGLWKIVKKTDRTAIGYSGLWFFFDEVQPQLLYALDESFSGLGLATEAASAVVEYAFSKLQFSYLVAAMDEPHTTSQSVAARLGFELIEKRTVDGKLTVFFRKDNHGSRI